MWTWSVNHWLQIWWKILNFDFRSDLKIQTWHHNRARLTHFMHLIEKLPQTIYPVIRHDLICWSALNCQDGWPHDWKVRGHCQQLFKRTLPPAAAPYPSNPSYGMVTKPIKFSSQAMTCRLADLTIEKLADTATSCSCGGRHCHWGLHRHRQDPPTFYLPPWLASNPKLWRPNNPPRPPLTSLPPQTPPRSPTSAFLPAPNFQPSLAGFKPQKIEDLIIISSPH